MRKVPQGAIRALMAKEMGIARVDRAIALAGLELAGPVVHPRGTAHVVE